LTIKALRSRRCRIALNLRGEFCAIERRREFGVDRLVEFVRRLVARGGQLLSTASYALSAAAAAFSRTLSWPAPGADQRNIRA
jgi:hypothetical protein